MRYDDWEDNMIFYFTKILPDWVTYDVPIFFFPMLELECLVGKSLAGEIA